MSIEREALVRAMHAERAEADTRDIDCWACEAGRSKAIEDLLHTLALANGASGHANALIESLFPDEAERLDLWRGYWRGVLADKHHEDATSGKESEEA